MWFRSGYPISRNHSFWTSGTISMLKRAQYTSLVKPYESVDAGLKSSDVRTLRKESLRVVSLSTSNCTW